MVLLSMFFTNQIHGGIISRLFFIHFVSSMHLLFIWRLKYLLRLSVWRFEHVSLTYICRLCSLQNASRTALCCMTILLSENIPNIWHKSSNKHKEVRQIETLKTIMQTARPRITPEEFCQWLRLPFRKYSIKCERFRLWIVLFWTKTSQRLTLYLPLSSHR